MEKDDRYIVPGLIRGLSVLQEFGRDNRELSISEIAAAIGANRSSCFRIVHTLEHCGFIHKVGNSNRYTLSSRVLDLGFRFLASLDVLEPSRPILEKLRDEVTIATQLMIMEDSDLVVVESFQATGPFTTTIGIGTRLPVYGTMAGMLMLSTQDDENIRQQYKDCSFERYTDATPANVDELLEKIAEVRGKSSVIAWGHYDPAMAACAAPVFSVDRKRIVAVVSISCPIGSFSRDEFEGRIATAAINAAEELSSTMSLYTHN